MLNVRSWVISAGCVSLLAVQMSGLHMHVNAEGYSGTPQGVHVHDTHSHDAPAHEHSVPVDHEHTGGQGHAGDQDVSIAKVTPGVPKLPFDLIALVFILLLVLRSADKITPRTTSVLRPQSRHEHWRPPLRAPPRLSLIPSL